MDKLTNFVNEIDQEKILSTISNVCKSKAFLITVGVGTLSFIGLCGIRNQVQGGVFDRMATMVRTDYTGRTILITGGNSGLGLEVAKHFAKYNANIIITVRSDSKGKTAIEQISKCLPDSSTVDNIGKIKYYILDTSSIESTNNFIDKLLKDANNDKTGFIIDYYSFNAGIVTVGNNNENNKLTKDGLHKIFATNYFNHWLISYKLSNYMLKCANKRIIEYNNISETNWLNKYGAPIRIVSTSSQGHASSAYGLYSNNKKLLNNDKYFFKISKEDCTYMDSKYIQILHMIQMQRNLLIKNNNSNNLIWYSSIAPGMTRSTMFMDLLNSVPFFVKIILYATWPIFLFITRTPDIGCQVIIHCMSNNDKGIEGGYWKNCIRRIPYDSLKRPIYESFKEAQHLFDNTKQLYQEITNEVLE